MNKSYLYGLILLLKMFSYPLAIQAAEIKQASAQQKELTQELIAAMSDENIDPTTIQCLLQRGANPNARTVVQMTNANEEISEDTVPLIMRAIYAINFDVVLLFFQQNANVNAVDQRNASILLRTLAFFNDLDENNQNTLEDILDILLVHPNIQIDAEDNEGHTPLSKAIELGQLAHAQKLLKAGADINKRVGGNKTPLIRATEMLNLEAVSFLLTKGANPSLRDNEGNRALYYVTIEPTDDEPTRKTKKALYQLLRRHSLPRKEHAG